MIKFVVTDAAGYIQRTASCNDPEVWAQIGTDQRGFAVPLSTGLIYDDLIKVDMTTNTLQQYAGVDPLEYDGMSVIPVETLEEIGARPDGP